MVFLVVTMTDSIFSQTKPTELREPVRTWDKLGSRLHWNRCFLWWAVPRRPMIEHFPVRDNASRPRWAISVLLAHDKHSSTPSLFLFFAHG